MGKDVNELHVWDGPLPYSRPSRYLPCLVVHLEVYMSATDNLMAARVTDSDSGFAASVALTVLGLAAGVALACFECCCPALAALIARRKRQALAGRGGGRSRPRRERPGPSPPPGVAPRRDARSRSDIELVSSMRLAIV